MGKLYNLIQAHIDAQPYRVTDRQVAKTFGVTQTTLTNWRAPKTLIGKKHLMRIVEVTGVPYETVRDALLDDIDYLKPDERSEADEGNSSATSA
jgi:transcriptional regulator with XRE-family HTH domain